jgi:hypothetical protein
MMCMQMTKSSEPDWLLEMRESGKCRSDVKHLSQLTPEENARLLRMQKSYKKEFLKEWPRTLIDGILPFKKC